MITISTIILALFFGLAIGSFLNVVIYRLPQQLDGKDININYPKRSFCPNCKTQLSILENIPLVSYLVQKGRCKHCNIKISGQYPTIEIITALLTLAIIIQLGITMQSGFILLFIYGLICLFVIDWQTQYLPDILTLPLLWLGLLFNLNYHFIDLSDAVIGGIIGYLFLWSIYWIFKLLRNKEGMGYGDFKLLAMFGAWFGWQSLTTILLFSSIVGIIYSLIFLRKNLDKPFAFGPFIILGAGFYYLQSII
ncbi:Leader peptidase (Prepilin peptidase) / N-methyltransferase [hydrothermal vent metagenome]|uniref:Leader peptidase (Prepilin peptidase) / N-methyltransferase n=1 Tax=hydrothermal vent metagenome TaxID=652676 RepID=A0A1W1C0E0_9ZZZZ